MAKYTWYEKKDEIVLWNEELNILYLVTHFENYKLVVPQYGHPNIHCEDIIKFKEMLAYCKQKYPELFI